MELSSKFSLYDILAMIIPGGVILASLLIKCEYLPVFEKTITYCCGCRISEFNMDMIQAVIYLVVSYVIGLINNWVCDGIYKGFRDNPIAIRNALLQTLQFNGNINLKNIVGSTYNKSKECILCLPCILANTFFSIISRWPPCQDIKRHESIVINYYKAYYALSEANLLGSVPLVENQIALFRNSIIPVTVLSCMIMPGCQCQILLSIIFVFMIFVVMVQRQQKVYRMIWESANYYKLCNEKSD